MSIRLRTSFFAASLLLGTAVAAPSVRAQAVSAPSNDQTQTSTSAVQKAQNSTIDQPNNRLPTNPHTIMEQPDQPPPNAPGTMSRTTSETGPVPSNQKDVHKLSGKHQHTHKKTSAATDATPQTSSPE
ncbi:hypothetical protein [Gluconobacter roseus]|uniref:Uncharacterized protein n=1 Tax=Gluconobacter roseus NBRC 3990 TaxID=1307950 RepID=A0A4Y3MCD8_9PROT|nr:hypothetical protein [Gluconobacter roseus]GBR49668.1 hypothetical protein AA3990_2601 [Gluconobacter roseus NBRC 3990]GEB04029.1 hypothetical protein GRO01_16050 [Gluconobacter roseus NBRC 3990]GLP92474.1 hypothetical protein GCM10007871_04520 [Gluconobacter roseus NBRC 3990]